MHEDVGSSGGTGTGGAQSAKNGKNSGRLIPGLILIGLGLLALLGNLGFYLIGNVLSAAIFGGLAYYVYQNGVRTGREGMRLLAIPLAGLALVTLFPGRAAGALFLAFLGLAFAVVWRADRRRWWAIIPAGTLGSLAATAALSRLPGNFTGFVFLGGLAATFYLLTRLRVDPQAWAIYPAVALGAVAALALLGGGGSWLFPLLLLAAGVILLARSGVVSIGWLDDLMRSVGLAPRQKAAPRAEGDIVPAPRPGAPAAPATTATPADIAPADIAPTDVAPTAPAATGTDVTAPARPDVPPTQGESGPPATDDASGQGPTDERNG